MLVDEHAHVCVTDFGLCNPLLGVENSGLQFGSSGTFLAPEQQENVYSGEAADMFALGVSLKYMRDGRRVDWSKLVSNDTEAYWQEQ